MANNKVGRRRLLEVILSSMLAVSNLGFTAYANDFTDEIRCSS